MLLLVYECYLNRLVYQSFDFEFLEYRIFDFLTPPPRKFSEPPDYQFSKILGPPAY